MALTHVAGELAIERCPVERAQPGEGLGILTPRHVRVLPGERPLSGRRTQGLRLALVLEPLVVHVRQMAAQAIEVDLVRLCIGMELLVRTLMIGDHLVGEVLHVLRAALRLGQICCRDLVQVRLVDERDDPLVPVGRADLLRMDRQGDEDDPCRRFQNSLLPVHVMNLLGGSHVQFAVRNRPGRFHDSRHGG